MSFTSIDPEIRDWARRHSLKLFTSQGESEIRAAYVSSVAGECFNIWIEAPEHGRTCVHAGCVEGREEDEPPQDWPIAVSELESTLEKVFEAVTDWMAPSTRYFP